MKPTDSAIKDLYKVFSKHKLLQRFHDRCSPIGTRRALARRLEEGERRSLDARDLAIYAFKAGLTMGNASDFKYFLPRILEVCATDPKWRRSESTEATAFVALERLGYADWPHAQQEPIRRFTVALWNDVVHDPEPPMLIHEYGIAVDVTKLDLAPLLTDWTPPWPNLEIQRILYLISAYFSGESFLTAGPAVENWLAREDVAKCLRKVRLEWELLLRGELSDMVWDVSMDHLDQAIALGANRKCRPVNGQV